MKLNILQVADFNGPYGGNFISSLEALHNEVEKENSNTYYLFPEKVKEYGWIKELYKKNYKIYFYTDSLIKNYFLIYKIVKKHKINIFHMHFRNMKIALPVTIAHLSFKNTVYFTHMHGQYEKSMIIKECLKRIARYDTFYIGCSKAIYNQLVGSGINPNRVICVDNAIDFSRLDKFDTLENYEYGIDDNTKKILMFGYDWYIKGVDIALDAVERMIKENKKVVLMIVVAVNRKKMEDYVVRRFGRIPEWLIFLNPRNDVASYYNFADVFISPSRTEGLPYSLVEAAYSRIPIIASDISAQKSVKLLGDVWFKSEDIEHLEEQIIKALKKNDINSLEAQKKSVLENYNLKRWTKEILYLYKNVNNKEF